MGPYSITAKLGEGGMGEVYRAHDAKLGRDVALKVLPAAVQADPERLARFEREAKVLAQLNHPNIAQIYGLEHQGEIRALVMELVDGPTLADRLESGVFSSAESFSVALQITLALEEAHEKGIVHRDLKPQNIKASTDGRVKVLDFGLAKAMDPIASASGGAAPGTLANSPTLTAAHGTQMGMILGTAAYMAPEQARGIGVDKRADIWAFGVVLWEMLTGKRLFEGELVTDVLADVLRKEVGFGELPAETPPAIRRLLRRCLERNPKNRLHDIADARLVIEEVLGGRTEEPAVAPAAAARPRGAAPLLPWTIAALAVVAAIAGWIGRGSGPETSAVAPEPTVLGFVVPHEHRLPQAEEPLLDLAADGRTLVFVAEGPEGARIFRRGFDRLAPRPIEGTQGGVHPVLSPDGRWVAFFAGGQLRKVPVEGGVPSTVAEARAPRGAAWAPDGSLVYSPRYNSALFRVPAAGGRPVAATTLDEAAGERSHRWPQVLPDGRTVLFTVGLVTSPGDYDDAVISAVRLDTGERKTVLTGARMARYAAGYLVYQRGGTLLAVRFDPERLEPTGEPFAIHEGTGGEASSGAGYFAVSREGAVAIAPDAAILRELTLVLVDAAGRETEIPVPPSQFNSPRFSPDGRQLAVAIGTGSAADDDVYLVEIAAGRLQRLTFGQGHGAPAWSEDGERLLYTNGRSGETGLYIRRADGAGGEQRIHRAAGASIADSWLPGTQRLAITETENTFDIHLLVADGSGAIEPLFASPTVAEYAASFSPDGRYIAYSSAETGTDEVFVETFPTGRGKWQVSPAGGSAPLWSRDGRHLYYVSGGSLMVVDVEPGAAFRAGSPRTRLTGAYLLGIPPRRYYDVGPDDVVVVAKRKFVASAPRELVVLDGWQAADPAKGREARR